MQIFANGKQNCYSFMDVYLLHLKKGKYLIHNTTTLSYLDFILELKVDKILDRDGK